MYFIDEQRCILTDKSILLSIKKHDPPPGLLYNWIDSRFLQIPMVSSLETRISNLYMTFITVFEIKVKQICIRFFQVSVSATPFREYPLEQCLRGNMKDEENEEA